MKFKRILLSALFVSIFLSCSQNVIKTNKGSVSLIISEKNSHNRSVEGIDIEDFSFNILFECEKEIIGPVTIQANEEFTQDNVPVGMCKVSVDAFYKDEEQPSYSGFSTVEVIADDVTPVTITLKRNNSINEDIKEEEPEPDIVFDLILDFNSYTLPESGKVWCYLRNENITSINLLNLINGENLFTPVINEENKILIKDFNYSKTFSENDSKYLLIGYSDNDIYSTTNIYYSVCELKKDSLSKDNNILTVEQNIPQNTSSNDFDYAINLSLNSEKINGINCYEATIDNLRNIIKNSIYNLYVFLEDSITENKGSKTTITYAGNKNITILPYEKTVRIKFNGLISGAPMFTIKNQDDTGTGAGTLTFRGNGDSKLIFDGGCDDTATEENGFIGTNILNKSRYSNYYLFRLTQGNLNLDSGCVFANFYCSIAVSTYLAGDGGSIIATTNSGCKNVSLNINDVLFKNNYCSKDGGVLCLYQNSDSYYTNVTIKESDFENNYSNSNGYSG